MKAKQVVVNGVLYPSIRRAAEALGISRKAALYATKQGRDLSSVEPGRKIRKGERIAENPITIRGVDYPSRAIAAEVLGVSRQAISMANARGRLDFVGLGRTGCPKKDE